MKPILKYDVLLLGYFTEETVQNFLRPVQENLNTTLSQCFQPIHDKQSPDFVLLILSFPFQIRHLWDLIKQQWKTSKSTLAFLSYESWNFLNGDYRIYGSVLIPLETPFDFTIIHKAPGKKNIFPLLLRKEKIPVRSVGVEKTRFCNFIYRNEVTTGGKLRKRFCQQLMEYKHVDCPSGVLHNLSIDLTGPGAKTEFMSHYRFSICFENHRSPWYVSEKILGAYHARSIPIYWGCPEIKQIFNPNSFINVDDFPNWEACIDHIKQVDQDPSLYNAYLAANPYGNLNDVLNPDFKMETIRKQFLALIKEDLTNKPRIKWLRLLKTAAVVVYIPLALLFRRIRYGSGK